MSARTPPPSGPVTARLYLEDARRKTALATVTGRAAGVFLLDRSIFHAARKDYHHVQPSDRGHVLAEGHKLKLDRVFVDDRGRLVHRTQGPVPKPGAKAQLHLEADRRERQARAHTAMHLLVAAAAEARATILDAPRLVGGGEARLHVHLRAADAGNRDALVQIVKQAERLAAQRLDVVAQWMPRDAAAHAVTHHPVPLEDVAPDEPTLRVVRIGEASVLPCDAPLVENTRDVGELRLALVQWQRDGSVRFGARLVA